MVSLANLYKPENFSRRCQTATQKAIAGGYLHKLYPHAKKQGRELRAGDIYGGPGDSFGINTVTGKWADFATGEDRGGDLVSLIAARENISQPQALELLEKEMGIGPLPPKPRKELPPAPTAGAPSKTWVYTDQHGHELYRAQRWEKPGHSKSCRMSGLSPDVEKVPLYLPEVLAAIKNRKLVFITEGEPKADLLRSWGITATTFANGVKGYQQTMARWFAGAGAVILVDADEPGREFGRRVASDLARLKNEGIKVIELPEPKFEGYDLVDWRNDGGTFEKLAALVKDAPLFKTSEKRNHSSLPMQPVTVEELPVPAPPIDDEIPEALLHPGGLIEKIMDYIEKSTVASFPLFSMAAALTLVGTLIGQKVMTETGLRTNLYIFALAPSGTGKNAPISAIKKLMFEAACNEAHLGPSHLASSAALISELSGVGKQSLLLLFDEIGDLIGSVKNKNNVAKNEMIQLLKELHSCTDSVYSKSFADSKNNLMVHRPHLSLYATGVPSKFWSNFSFGEVSDGFLPRALVLSIDLEIKKKKKVLLAEPPADLFEAIKTLAGTEKQHVGNLSTTPVPQAVPKTAEAEAFFDQWDDRLLALQNQARNAEDGRGEIYNRAAEQAHKIALIHAVSLAGGLPESVGLESVKFAIELVDWAIPRMIKHITANVSSGELDGLRKKIMVLVDKKGAASKRDVYRNISGCTSRLAEEALKMLEETRELIPVKIEHKNGRVSLAWMRPKEDEAND